MDMEKLIIQGGFAGLSVILIWALVWLGKAFIKTMQDAQKTIIQIATESNAVVRDNSEVLRELKNSHKDMSEKSDKLFQEFLRRPCLQKKYADDADT